MNDDDKLEIAKEISSLVGSREEKLARNARCFPSYERIFFESILAVSGDRGLSITETIDVIKVYLRYAKWIGLLVCDSSPFNGNGTLGDTWALVRPAGILASFGGGKFQAIYEPDYDIVDDDEYSSDDDLYDNDSISENEFGGLSQFDAAAERYLKSLFGVTPAETDFDDDSYVVTLPEGFRNPLILEHFANGGQGQEVIGVSGPLLRRDRVQGTDEWVKKHRNRQGTATSFDILATAALDFHNGRPVVRQLRSWTEDDYILVSDAVLMMAAIWPKYLQGKLTFVSSHHRSWIVIEQGAGRPILFERENWPTNTALSRILERLVGLRSMRGMTCLFDLMDSETVAFNGECGKIVRPISDKIESNSQSQREAVLRLSNKLISIGYEYDTVRSVILDPLRLAELIDPDGMLLRNHRAHPEQRHFEMAVTIENKKQNFGSKSIGRYTESFSTSGRDELYNALDGNGRDKVYLTDGLWISPDGNVSDEGR
ncbi:hypothetical protein [Thetidibacter halocola]|uniref:Uncharacterized protein n=1 Tax=Thetidibacter halocola TaxID=2827239 RepID=A0A8J7WF89_9RHOB|nr:hypothetical protein [Thetidibacter halocola]MBS0126530.1 hypothetical protein [Thetidibacter halocola]